MEIPFEVRVSALLSVFHTTEVDIQKDAVHDGVDAL